MESLAKATGESSFLGVARNESSVEYIAKVVSSYDVRCDAELGKPRPLHSTSVGLAVLAFQPKERTEQFLRQGRFERCTPRTVCDATQLRREIVAVRERGYSLVRDTNSPGASGIAAPLFDGNGGVIAALNLSAPSSRFDAVLKKAQQLVRAADCLSRELAGSTTQHPIARKSHE
jgi:DNA-binding IclR family transcriptional regulator